MKGKTKSVYRPQAFTPHQGSEELQQKVHEHSDSFSIQKCLQSVPTNLVDSGFQQVTSVSISIEGITQKLHQKYS